MEIKASLEIIQKLKPGHNAWEYDRQVRKEYIIIPKVIKIGSIQKTGITIINPGWGENNDNEVWYFLNILMDNGHDLILMFPTYSDANQVIINLLTLVEEYWSSVKLDLEYRKELIGQISDRGRGI
ncbi:MAG: hypothetical protein KAS32_12080 [Candidatus Peribacteraceae bacterium]|nr:hypothetical protein [Candidatus Peribacteraceae bacterium]